MIGALNTSICAMNAYSEQVSMVSNNVANVETTGYKSNNMSFSDVLNASITGTSGTTRGGSVQIQDVSSCWDQGSMSTTGESTDMAINGGGFFCLQSQSGDATSYTRDGNFEFDNNGALVNSDGMAVLGYPIDENGVLGTLESISISYEPFQPTPTSEITMEVNLNSSFETDETYSTPTAAYDSLGNEIPVTTTYIKNAAANTWDYEVTIPSELGTVSGDNTGTLTFDEFGSLVAGVDPVFVLDLSNGASASQSISWNLYDDSGVENGSFTQYAGTSVVYSQEQDGYASGELYDVSINTDGVIVGSYSNGKTQNLSQMALAEFNNTAGLSNIGGNCYVASSDSGVANMGTPGTGALGSISAGNLEMSNVDLGTEIANLLTAQSAFEANSRTFSVANEMLQTVLQLK